MTVFTRVNFVADFLQAKCDFRGKTAVSRFWAPLGDLGATYDDNLRLVGKRVGDFILVLTFFARYYGWGATSDYWFKIGDFAPTCPVDPKFQVEGVAPTNHSSYQKTMLNVLSYGIKIKHIFLPFCHNARVWLTDRRIDGQNSHRKTASAFHATR